MDVPISRAKATLTELVSRAEAGEEVILTRHGRPADAAACREATEREPNILISAGTPAEALIVSARRGVRHRMADLADRIEAEVIPVTAETAREAADAYDRWGKGVHPAALNFADCFAYPPARRRSVPLLYVGDDFRRTDVAGALD